MKGVFNHCIILGANSDMALATFKLLVDQGETLSLLSRDPEITKQLIPSSTSIANVSFNSFNLNQPESISTHIDSLESGCKYLIVSFIGSMFDNVKCIEDSLLSIETMQSNYTNQVLMFNKLIPFLKQNPGSVLVSVSSVAGERGRASNFIYGSSKAGITAYLSGLRNYLFPFGVHVITVKPGFVRTKMTAGMSLPPALTSSAEYVAVKIQSAIKSRKNVIYISWKWRWIMLIIKSIPEFIFKKLKL